MKLFSLLLAGMLTSITGMCQFVSAVKVVDYQRIDHHVFYDGDQDGDKDIYFLGSTGRVGLHRNMGSGLFGPTESVIWAGNQSRRLHLGNTGLQTFLIASFTDSVRVFSFGPNGHLVPFQTISSPFTSRIFVTDIDSDGDEDIILSTGSTTYVSKWTGNSFTPRAVLFSGFGVSNNTLDFIAIADFDNDGVSDIVINYNNTHHILLEDTASSSYAAVDTFPMPKPGIVQYAAVYADSDTLIDIVTWLNLNNSGYNNFYVEKGLGNGTFSPAVLIEDSIWGVTQWQVGDLNGDNKAEIMYSSNVSVELFANDGTGNFSRSVFDSLRPQGVGEIFLTDVNGDNLPDYTVSFGFSWVRINNGGFNFSVPEVYTGSPSPTYDLQAEDLNGDGKDEVLYMNNQDQVMGLKHHSGLKLIPFAVAYPNLGPVRYIDAVDLNNDQQKEVLGNSSASFFTATNNNGLFSPDQVFVSGSSFSGARDIESSDFNADGFVDAYTTSYNAGNVHYFPGTATGFATPVQVASKYGVDKIVSVDVNGDGLKDPVYSSGSSDLTYNLNLGGGSFGPSVIFGTNLLQINGLHVEDIDQDGDEDLLVVSDWNNPVANIYQFLNTGSGFAPVYTIGSNTMAGSYIYPADLNNDGFKDLVFASRFTNKIGWYQNTGGGNWIFGNFIDSLPAVPRYPVAGDFDGDGDMDVIATTSTVFYLYENIVQSTYQVKGNFFHDYNQNGTRDTGEPGLPFVSLSTSSGTASYTDNLGNYIGQGYPGTVSITPTMPPHWVLTTDSASYSVVISSTSPVIDSLDFGFIQDTVYSDISPSLAYNPGVCSDTSNIWISYKNTGMQIENGIVSFVPDSMITFISSIPAADSLSGGIYYWSFSSLGFYQTNYINVKVINASAANIGDTTISYLFVTILDSSSQPSAVFSDSVSRLVACSYDPNVKKSSPSMGTEGFIPAGETIDYVIHFQNTGNDTAITVVIRDQLSSYLDRSSFSFQGSSHYCQVSIDSSDRITFRFPNILLPDSATNPSASCGYVNFSIKSDSLLPAGTVIPNHAEIYFDLNPPIITDTTISTIYECPLTVDINLQQSGPFCLNSGIYAVTNADTSSFNSFWWDHYSGTSNGFQFNSPADSSGTHSIKLTWKNPYCSLQDSLQYTVLPENISYPAPVSICPGDSALIHSTYVSNAGFYSDTLVSVIGCDSIVISEVLLYALDSVLVPASICKGDSLYAGGAYQYTTGNYTDVFQNVYGCDSIVSTALLVTEVDTAVTSLSGTLTATSPTGTFSWIDCQSMTIIPGATGSSYYPGTDGVFAVIVTEGSCMDTSSCFVISYTGNLESTDDVLLLFPNPADREFTIKVKDGRSILNVRIYSITGQLVLDENGTGNQMRVKSERLVNGVYKIHLLDSKGHRIEGSLIIAR